MYIRVVLLLFSLIREWQVAEADCRKNLCAESPGIQFGECVFSPNSRLTPPQGSKECTEIDCSREYVFENTKCEWFDAPDDVEYIAITEIDIKKDTEVTVHHITDHKDECKVLWLDSRANGREKVIIKLQPPKRKFKISATEPTAKLTFKCNKVRSCTKKNDNSRIRRIVRGEEAKMNEFPFMANLYTHYSTHKSDDNYAICNTFGYISLSDTQKNCCDNKPIIYERCGGSILNKNWVLTAAHCVHPTKIVKINGVDTKHYLVGVLVVAGDHKRDANEADETLHWTKPMNVKPNTEYNPKTLDSDIALLRLSQRIDLKEGTRYPICLAPSNMDGLDGCEVEGAGWGRKDDNKTSNVLRKGTFKIHDDCGDKFTKNMLCFKDDETNVCNGDSGGPLFCDSANDFYYQVGVFSFGAKVDEANKADLWKKGGAQGATKVVNFLKWINEETMGKLP